MAKEIPEYQRRAQITPASDSVGAKQAYSGEIQASEALSSMGANIASQAGHARARLSGLEAGEKPGKSLLPPITPMDKTYHEAYVERSSQVLSNNFNEYVNNRNIEFGKKLNPTAQDLANYTKDLSQAAEKGIQFSDKRVRHNLETNFKNTIASNTLQYARLVQKADVSRLKGLFNNTTKTNSENMYNFARSGDLVGTQEAYFAQKKNLEDSRDLIGEDNYNNGLESARLTYYGSIHEAGMLQAYQEGGVSLANEYLQDFVSNKQIGLSDSDKESMLPQLTGRLSKQNMLESLNDDLMLKNAELEILKTPGNILSPDRQAYYQENLSETGNIKLELQQLKLSQKAQTSANLAVYMSQNKDNPTALSMMSGKEKDEAFKTLVSAQSEQAGRPLELQEQAQIANVFDTDISTFQGILTSNINSSNPETAALGSQVYKAMKPNTVDGLDAKTKLRASIIDSKIKANMSAIDAVKFASKQMDGITEQGFQERAAELKEILVQKGISNTKPANQKAYVAKSIGFDAKLMPDGIQTEYMNALEYSFMQTQDLEVSSEFAANEMLRSYSEFEGNGFKQVFKDAPDRSMPLPIVQQQMDQNLSGYFKLLNDNFEKNGNIDYRYELRPFDEKLIPLGGVGMSVNEQLFNKAALEQSKKEHRFRAVRIDRKGNEVVGHAMIMPDDITDRRAPGEPQSWSWVFRPEGMSNISNINSITDDGGVDNARFYFSEKAIAEINQLDFQKLMAKKEFEDYKRMAKQEVVNREGILPDLGSRLLLKLNPKSVVEDYKKRNKIKNDANE